MSSPLYPTMHINSLPSLVFRLIFSRLSLHDQLQVGRVCWLWKDYQRDITRKVRSLTLLIGVETFDRPWYLILPLDLIVQSPFTLHHCNELLNNQGDGPLFAIQHNSGLLNVAYLNMSNVNLLLKSLPNVHSLNISINGIHCYVIEHVICLLNQWKDKLVTFKLWCNFSDGIPLDVYDRCPEVYQDMPIPLCLTLVKLLKSINSLSTLDHLTLDFNHQFYYSANKSHIPNYDFSILSRLLEFNFRSLDYYFRNLPMYEWLKQCDANGTRLQRIGLDYSHEYFQHVMDLPLVCGRISSLPLLDFYDKIQTNIRQCSNVCHSLTTLKFEFIESGLVQLLNMLAPLKQLIHLQLNLEPISPDGHYIKLFDDFKRTPSHQISQLPSVKLLTLKKELHSNLDSLHWGWIFPNVQILQMEHNCFGRFYPYCKCFDLDIWDQGDFITETLEELESAMRQLLDTFKQLPKLRRIYLNDYEKKYEQKYVLVKFNFTL